MKKRIIAALAICLFPAIELLANGIYLNGIGTRAISMGGAFIGLADDYSAVFWNPAGLTQLKRSTFFLFETNQLPRGVVAKDAFCLSRAYASGAAGYLYSNRTGRLVLGLCSYMPSGIGISLDSNDLPIYRDRFRYRWQSLFRTVTICPVAAFGIGESISLGAALNLSYSLLDSYFPIVNILEYDLEFGQYHEKNHGWSVGGTFGVLFKPARWLNLGLTARTASKVNLRGTATWQVSGNLGSLGPAIESVVQRSISLPLWLGGGMAFKPVDGLTITADAQFTNWKELSSKSFRYDNPQWINAPSVNPFDLDWTGKVQYRVGMEYEFNPGWALRAGYYSDPAPGSNFPGTIIPAGLTEPSWSTRNFFNFPVASYNAGTFGLGYQSERMRLDIGVECLASRDVNSMSLKIWAPSIAFAYHF